MNVGDRVRVVNYLGRDPGFNGREYTVRNILDHGVPRPVQVEENHDLLFHPDELEVIE